MKKRSKRNIGDEIIAGLEEAIRFERGGDTGAVMHIVPISARHATVDPAPEYTAAEIAAVRQHLRLTQPVFAQALSVSPETVKAWEQGKFSPQGAARRLLEIAMRAPQTILAVVHTSANTRTASQFTYATPPSPTRLVTEVKAARKPRGRRAVKARSK